MKICFMNPAKTKLRRGEPLNVLVGADSSGESAHVFRFFAETEDSWREIYAERREFDGCERQLHLYFTVPPEKLAACLRPGEDELVLTVSDCPPEGDGGEASALIEII